MRWRKWPLAGLVLIWCASSSRTSWQLPHLLLQQGDYSTPLVALRMSKHFKVQIHIHELFHEHDADAQHSAAVDGHARALCTGPPPLLPTSSFEHTGPWSGHIREYVIPGASRRFSARVRMIPGPLLNNQNTRLMALARAKQDERRGLFIAEDGSLDAALRGTLREMSCSASVNKVSYQRIVRSSDIL